MAKILKKKFFEVDLPLIEEKYESYNNLIENLNNRIIKVDATRKLRGKNVDLIFQVKVKDNKAIGVPRKLILLPYFIKHMLHTGIDYVEDSFNAETQESKVMIKPFLITRKKVSRAVRKTLRNSTKNWIVDYLKTKKDEEVFQEILSNQFQKLLSIKLKKIYPLAICEIRIFEVGKPLSEKPIQVEEKKAEEKVEEKVEESEEKKEKKTKAKKTE